MKVSNAALLLLTGIAAGAIAGLLLAPEEGEKTRKKLWKKSQKFKRDFEDKASEYKEKAADIKEKFKNAANDVKKNFS
jgi:gas vesicle protein